MYNQDFNCKIWAYKKVENSVKSKLNFIFIPITPTYLHFLRNYHFTNYYCYAYLLSLIVRIFLCLVIIINFIITNFIINDSYVNNELDYYYIWIHYSFILTYNIMGY